MGNTVNVLKKNNDWTIRILPQNCIHFGIKLDADTRYWEYHIFATLLAKYIYNELLLVVKTGQEVWLNHQQEILMYLSYLKINCEMFIGTVV